MKYVVKTKDSPNHTYGVWNNEMCAFQHVSEWNGTETLDLEDANAVAERLCFNSLVETWMKAYGVTCPTVKKQKQRLKEL